MASLLSIIYFLLQAISLPNPTSTEILSVFIMAKSIIINMLKATGKISFHFTKNMVRISLNIWTANGQLLFMILIKSLQYLPQIYLQQSQYGEMDLRPDLTKAESAEKKFQQIP